YSSAWGRKYPSNFTPDGPHGRAEPVVFSVYIGERPGLAKESLVGVRRHEVAVELGLIAVLQRILVLALTARLRNSEIGGQVHVEKTQRPHLGRARQVGQAGQAVMLEEGVGGAEGHRPAGRAAAAAHLDQAHFQP